LANATNGSVTPRTLDHIGDVKTFCTFIIHGSFFTFLTLFILRFFILKTEKWHTHIIKQQIKMTFSFVMQQS